MDAPEAQGTVQEMCAAISANSLAQAVSKLILCSWEVEPPIAALRASLPNVLHFELRHCNQIAASSLSEAVAAWPMLQSISITTFCSALLAAQQHLEAAARTAAELKAEQPFEVVLRVCSVLDEAQLDALVDAIQSASGGEVAVRCTAAELKAEQPFEVVLRVCSVLDEAQLDALVAAIQSASGGEVAVRCISTRVDWL